MLYSALGIKPFILSQTNCDTAFNDKEILPLSGSNVGSYNNLPHILICSRLVSFFLLLFLCNLQTHVSCW